MCCIPIQLVKVISSKVNEILLSWHIIEILKQRQREIWMYELLEYMWVLTDSFELFPSVSVKNKNSFLAPTRHILSIVGQPLSQPKPG